MKNPYVDLPRSGLYDACQARVGDLLEPSGPRSPEQRKALAEDTAFLLLAVGRWLLGSRGHRLEISRAHAGEDVARTLMEQYERDARRSRFDAWMEGLGMLFPRLSDPERQRVGAPYYQAAMASAEGLQAGLVALEGIAHSRPRGER
jgi:hypothetical protein